MDQRRLAATGGITLPPVVAEVPPASPQTHRAAGGEAIAETATATGEEIAEATTADADDADEGAPDGTWRCHKCRRRNLPSKARCGNCQAWRGGKREGCAPHRRRAGAASLLAPPGQPWPCPCGHANAPTKVRCSVCQKWRGGRRNWTAGGDGNGGANNEAGGAWMCDKCGNENGPRKVRCNGCPRWRDGRRPAFRKKVVGQTAVQPIQFQPTMAKAATAAAATAAAVTAGGAAAAHAAPNIARGPPATLARNPLGAGWLCAGCRHPNAAAKKRCGACQRWKFGKRENMLKKHRRTAGAPALPPLAPPVEAGHGENGNVPFPAPIATEQYWACGCGQANLEGKSRCSNCQGWRGGKRGSLPRKPGGNGAPARLHRPHAPWECGRCGGPNGARKLRCGNCRSWKNAKKKVSEPHLQSSEGGATVAVPPAAVAPVVTTQPASPLRPVEVLAEPDWTCHGCRASVPGIKRRCPSCRCWRGGVRRDVSKLAPPWTCGRCSAVNEGRRARCGRCEGWRDGRRPGPPQRAEERPADGNWECGRCSKSNKASKVRCGGCQGWRGGERPDIRKGARPQPAGLPGGGVQLGQPTVGVPVPPQLAPMAAPLGPPNLMPLPVPLVPPGDAGKPPPPPLPGGALHWTCAKCTCDNLASEATCKICDCPRDQLMV
ncbi:hypothetical protein ACHAXT_002246 [Thalassiosira profunda]